MWTLIKTEQQLESVQEFDTLLRYTAFGIPPEELTGRSYCENYQVESIKGDTFSIQLIHDNQSVQSKMNAIYPSSVSKQSILQEGKWYHNTDPDSGGFLE